MTEWTDSKRQNHKRVTYIYGQVAFQVVGERRRHLGMFQSKFLGIGAMGVGISIGYSDRIPSLAKSVARP